MTAIFLAEVGFKYFLEFNRKNTFLLIKQNLRWSELIEKVMPLRAAIVKWSKSQNQLVMEKSNRYFKTEF